MPATRKLVSHAAKRTREAMVENLKSAIEREYPRVALSTAYDKIQAATGTSLSTMQRIMSGTTGPSIDTLADLAHHLGTTVADLVTPRKDALPDAPEPDAHASVQRLRRRRA